MTKIKIILRVKFKQEGANEGGKCRNNLSSIQFSIAKLRTFKHCYFILLYKLNILQKSQWNLSNEIDVVLSNSGAYIQ